jgi:hypothetical protein
MLTRAEFAEMPQGIELYYTLLTANTAGMFGHWVSVAAVEVLIAGPSATGTALGGGEFNGRPVAQA